MIENWFGKRYFHWLQLNTNELFREISTEFATYCEGIQVNLPHGDNITYCEGIQVSRNALNLPHRDNITYSEGMQVNLHGLNLLRGDNIIDNISTCISIPEDVRTHIKRPDDISDITYPFIDEDGNINPEELAKEINRINQKSANC